MTKKPYLRMAALGKFRAFRAGAQGLVGIEFAITGLTLALGLANAVDVGNYIYRRMEVENAADVGAQAAHNTCVPPCSTPQSCLPAKLPATQNCSLLKTAITSAIQSTSLSAAVALASGYPTEGYYCTTASNALKYMGSVSSPPPADCSAAGNAGVSPGDYIQVGVTYPYQPLFSGLSVMSALGWTSISKTSWMRMD